MHDSYTSERISWERQNFLRLKQWQQSGVLEYITKFTVFLVLIITYKVTFNFFKVIRTDLVWQCKARECGYVRLPVAPIDAV